MLQQFVLIQIILVKSTYKKLSLALGQWTWTTHGGNWLRAIYLLETAQIFWK